MKKIFFFIISAALMGCAGTDFSIGSPVAGNLFVRASVLTADAEKAVLQAEPLYGNKPEAGPIESLVAKVLGQTYLAEGSATSVNGVRVTVMEKRGDTLVIKPSAGLKTGGTVQIYIPKKTLIITDFKVLDSSKNTIGKLAFGEFSEKLTNSGRFAVLERKELSGILQEHALELKGLTDTEQAGILGRLLKAELMLAGDMTRVGFSCVFDIRIIDTATSKILGVARESTLCSKIADTGQMRSTSADFGDFETTETKGWVLGEIPGLKGRTVIDNTTGAEKTSASLMLFMDNINADDASGAFNRVKRDLSGFEAVTFWAKADKPITGVFFVDDEDEDRKSGNFDRWTATFWLTSEWKKYRLNLSEMVQGFSQRPDAKMNKGDKKFSPEMVMGSGFIFPKFKNRDINSAKIWIDELRFE